MAKKLIIAVCIVIIIAAYVIKKTHHANRDFAVTDFESSDTSVASETKFPAVSTGPAMVVTHSKNSASDMIVTHAPLDSAMKNSKRMSSSGH